MMLAPPSAAPQPDLPAGGIPIGPAANAAEDPNAALRFEDLTIDDDLPPLERVRRYCRSGIALQRLVHVKMLGEVARGVGTDATIQSLLPLVPPLVSDPESIIRQHLAAQLMPLSLALMHDGRPPPPSPPSPASSSGAADDVGKENAHGSLGGGEAKGGSASPHAVPDVDRVNPSGYNAVTTAILSHLSVLLSDADLDVRKCASDSIASLAPRLPLGDVERLIVPVAVRLANEPPKSSASASKKKKGKDHWRDGANPAAQQQAAAGARPSPEDLRTTAANLLADLASIPPPAATPRVVSSSILPTVVAMCDDNNFRVRRAAVQAMPRVMLGGTVDDAESKILPAFERMSKDMEMYRVRKSAGECLVDMSRSLMLLAKGGDDPSSDGSQQDQGGGRQLRERLLKLRRDMLIPIATALLADGNKFVRHGMMQFLGPFIASFYPLDSSSDGEGDGGVMSMLEDSSTDHNGYGQSVLGARFFPHASGMVGRLNASSAAAEAAAGAAAVEDGRTDGSACLLSEEDQLLSLLPPFLVVARADEATLRSIVEHRETHPPDPADLDAVRRHLLPPFTALATVDSGDENLDAEMRVYCAYSLPGVVLLMGRDGWCDEGGQLRDCFLSLSTGRAGSSGKEGSGGGTAPVGVPLPVKRCLASSIHTISHILGRQIVCGEGGSDDGAARPPGILSVFETYFLRDPDDTVRLNVVRNLPSFLSVVDAPTRSKFLPSLHSIMVGDSMLGATVRRSATNPQLLNWRQRDAVSQILPDLALLFGPREVRRYLWPILKMLLGDKVSAVRDDVEWCVPVILRRYAPENVAEDAGEGTDDEVKDPKRWSAEACEEVVSYLKWSLLENEGKNSFSGGGGGGSSVANGAFSRRQMFCRTCAAFAVALRLGRSSSSGDGERGGGGGGGGGWFGTPARKRNSSTNTWSGSGGGSTRSRHPYEDYTATEYEHIHTLLVKSFLPDALAMRSDRVSNVRLTLVASLRVMPEDVLRSEEVATVLRTLEEEMRTWDSGGDGTWGGADGSVSVSVSAAGSGDGGRTGGASGSAVAATRSDDAPSSLANGSTSSSKKSTHGKSSSASSGGSGKVKSKLIQERMAAFESTAASTTSEGGGARRSKRGKEHKKKAKAVQMEVAPAPEQPLESSSSVDDASLSSI